jgi:hypothetical protein
MAWRHDWAIAGRIDKPTIETVKGIRFAHIEDYKTNKILRTEGYDDKDMMLPPISHLPNCEMIHYGLQLSIYQYILEYFGYRPGIRRIIHFPHPIEGLGIPDPRIYLIPYYRNEIISMLTYLNHTGWLKSMLK